MASPAPLRLRPLEVGDLLDETFRMYRRHFLLFAGLSVILAIPSSALAGYGALELFGSFLQSVSTNEPLDISALVPSMTILAIGSVASLAIEPFVQGAVVYAACESALGHPVTLGGVIRGILRRYWAITGYIVLIVLMSIAFCLFPLWIWIQVGWVAVLPVLFVENARLTQAMGRSWSLVQDRWWRTFFILLLIFLLWYVVRLALGAVLALVNFLIAIVLSPVLTLAIISAVGELIYSLAYPVLQIAIVLIYFDLRVRKEGLDLFQLAQRVSALQQPA